MAKVEQTRRVARGALAIGLFIAGPLSRIQAQGSGHGFAAAVDTLVREMPNEEAALRRLYSLAAHRPLWLCDKVTDRPVAAANQNLSRRDGPR